jgi:catechol 2,3-dioxygenase-like lactoylglutathione lyase family enzyme
MSDRFHHIFISAADYEASVAFYRDILGWAVSNEWGGDGAARGTILSGGGTKVVIAERPANARGAAEAGQPSLYLDIHDVDVRYSKLPKGAHVVREPERTNWGTRWFVVRDPDGNLIAFEEVHGRG